MRRFLLISYVFPPAGGGGVQRPAKFAKYIGRFGWEPVVVTVKNPSVPSRDESLLKDLPPELIVRRLPTLEPSPPAEPAPGGGGEPGPVGRLKKWVAGKLFPDRHVLWIPLALPGALRAARRHKVEAVMVTAPPFSTFMLGAAVARRLDLPLVLDFRDEWSGYYAQGFSPSAEDSGRAERVLHAERRLVDQAARVIGASDAYCRRFRHLHGWQEEKYVWIPNGYDPDDFPPADQPPSRHRPGERLKLLYTGTVFAVTSLDPLWAGLAGLDPDKRRHWEVEICGRAVPGQVLDPGLEGLTVSRPGYLDHDEVIKRMTRADVLVLTLADLPGSQRVIPGKVFEYLAARRPILALVPRGEAAAIVNGCQAGRVVEPGNTAELTKLLEYWLDDPPPALGPPPEQFSRINLAGRLAEVLEQAVVAHQEADR